MRLILAAVSVVAGFVLGVLAITSLTPGTPAWLRPTLAMAWLLTLIAVAFITANRSPERNLPQKMRDGLIYVAIASAIVLVVVGLTIHDLDAGIHRNIRENWVVGIITAVLVCGYALKEVWPCRRNWQIWPVFGAYLVLQFSILVPVLGKLDRVPAIYIWPISMLELMALTFVLHFVIGDPTHSGTPAK